MDIAGQLCDVGIILDQDGFIAALKQVTASYISIIKSARIARSEPMHCLFQVCKIGSYQKVIMVWHQHISKNINIKALSHLPDRFQKQLAISITEKYPLPVIATGHQMI